MYQPTQEANALVNINAVFNAAKKGYDDGKNKSEYSYSSAAKAASKLIAVFPVLCSRSVSAETASMMTKYIESQGCMLLQMVLSASNISDSKDAMEYLSHYHQNINIGGIGLDAMQAAIGQWLDSISNQDANHTGDTFNKTKAQMSDVWDKAKNESSLDYHANLQAIMNGLQEMYNTKVYTSYINPISLNDYSIDEGNSSFSVTLNEAKTKKKNYNKSSADKSSDKEDNNISQTSKQPRSQLPLPQLQNSDVKKANNATPTILKVTFYRNASDQQGTSAFIGIKGSLIPVNTTEILRRIANDNEDGRYFLNFMRALTGETGFIKDFLLNLSRAEEDVRNVKKSGSYGDTWELLKNRARASKMAVRSGKESQFAAITTVVISKDDANSLYKEENIDIQDPKIARHFMESYNLLGFAIVDDVIESVKVMFDNGNNAFEEISYRMLERENSDSSIIKTINLMNKMK